MNFLLKPIRPKFVFKKMINIIENIFCETLINELGAEYFCYLTLNFGQSKDVTELLICSRNEYNIVEIIDLVLLKSNRLRWNSITGEVIR